MQQQHPGGGRRGEARSCARRCRPFTCTGAGRERLCCFTTWSAAANFLGYSTHRTHVLVVSRKHTYTCGFKSCQVDVTSCWLGTDQQTGGEQRHAFSYRVRVTNLRDTSIQVLGRSWDIMDANGQLGECS